MDVVETTDALLDDTGELDTIGEGEAIAPIHAHAHVDQVLAYRTKLDVAETVEAIQEIVYDLRAATIAEWSPEDRAEVRAWLKDGAAFDARPSVLGRPHVTAAVGEDATVQTCGACGAVLRTFDDGAEALPAGVLVRTDCDGQETEGQHYPDTAKPKKTRGRTSDAAPEAPAAKAPAKRGKKKSGR